MSTTPAVAQRGYCDYGELQVGSEDESDKEPGSELLVHHHGQKQGEAHGGKQVAAGCQAVDHIGGDSGDCRLERGASKEDGKEADQEIEAKGANPATCPEQGAGSRYRYPSQELRLHRLGKSVVDETCRARRQSHREVPGARRRRCPPRRQRRSGWQTPSRDASSGTTVREKPQHQPGTNRGRRGNLERGADRSGCRSTGSPKTRPMMAPSTMGRLNML